MVVRRAPRPRRPPERPAVRLTDPGEVAAAVPQLLGFRPEESLVVISLQGPDALRVGLTLRVDLPPEGHGEPLAEHVVQTLRRHRPAGVVAVLVTEAPDGPGPDLPQRELLHALTRALARAALPLHDALLVRDGRWWSYDCPRPCCMPGAGTELPVGPTVLEAASVAAGVVVARDRAALEERLTGAVAPELREACLRVARGRWLRAADVGWEGVADEARRAVRAALDRCGRSAPLRAPLTEQELAEVVWGLRDTAVRDWALRLCLGDDAAAAESLWTECTRRAPAPLDAAPATLLAVCAWLRGDGATANVALERALTADPDHTLARLLARALAGCLDPDGLRELIEGTLDGPGEG